MIVRTVNSRRKRKRKPTYSQRFGPSSVAYELGLLRLSLAMQREEDIKDDKDIRDR